MFTDVLACIQSQTQRNNPIKIKIHSHKNLLLTLNQLAEGRTNRDEINYWKNK
tara:strand:- start:489 stop:647 length:159 start_codon:yes stop_codon:yes gene_type:complete